MLHRSLLVLFSTSLFRSGLGVHDSPLGPDALTKRLQDWGIDFGTPPAAPEAREQHSLLGFRKFSDGKTNATDRRLDTRMEQAYGRQPDFLRDSPKRSAWIGSISTRDTFWLQFLSFGLLLKAACIVSNVVGQVSPMPSVKKFIEDGSTDESDALPYICIAFSGLQWCFYSTFAFLVTGNKGFLVVVYANVGGAVLGIGYTVIFLRFCQNEMTLASLHYYCRICGILYALQIGAILGFPRDDALLFSGFISAAGSISVAAAPVAGMRQVLVSRSVRAVPIALINASFFSSVLWLFCGMMLVDYWIIIPNCVSIVISGLCIGLLHYVSSGLLGPPNSAGPSEITPLVRSGAMTAPLRPKEMPDDDAGGTGGTRCTPEMPTAVQGGWLSASVREFKLKPANDEHRSSSSGGAPFASIMSADDKLE